ncbi:MAG: DUF4845 domain-containing protein [Betaproteobacteria bacterium]
MNKQRGIALSGLMFWGVIVAAVALLVIKVTPEVIDYYKINKSVQSTAANASGKTVGEIRVVYSKYAEIEHIQTITPADLDISKEGSNVVIAFSYEKRIPLFANVSLLIDFQGSALGRE